MIGVLSQLITDDEDSLVVEDVRPTRSESKSEKAGEGTVLWQMRRPRRKEIGVQIGEIGKSVFWREMGERNCWITHRRCQKFEA
jgi:hypothetical protein